MPSFLFHCQRIHEHRVKFAIELATRRYPELSVTHRFALRDADAEIWVIDAPSSDHVERWTDEAELSGGAVHGVDENRHPEPTTPARPTTHTTYPHH